MKYFTFPIRGGDLEAVRAYYRQRYFPGQRLNFQAVQPQMRADVIVENNDPAHPELVFRPQFT